MMKDERNRSGPILTDAKSLLPPKPIYDRDEPNMVTSATPKIQARFYFFKINFTDTMLIIYLIQL